MATRPRTTTVTCDKAERLCDAMDENPQLWRVYGDTIRNALVSMERTIVHQREQNHKIRGHGQEKDLSLRYLQMATKERLWRSRPHICERCDRTLTKAVHRVHHRVAIENGGTWGDDNLMVLCANCHYEIHEEQRSS